MNGSSCYYLADVVVFLVTITFPLTLHPVVTINNLHAWSIEFSKVSVLFTNRHSTELNSK